MSSTMMSLKEWINALVPIHAGMAIILREEWPDMLGGLYISEDSKRRSSRQSRLGVVLKLGEGVPYYNGVDEDAIARKAKLYPGCKVEFDPPNPIMAGHTLMWKFDKEYPIQKVHVSDIHCIWDGPIVWDSDPMIQELIQEQFNKFKETHEVQINS